MTVLIGLRCQDGAVLGSDSQETRVNHFRFWPKVSLVGSRFVVLSAGNPTMGEAFARHMGSAFRDSATGREGSVDRPRIARLIENVLLNLANEAGEEAVKSRQLLVAGLADDGELCLWAVDAGEIYLREMRTWECYGSGIDAAEMLMKDFYFPEVSTREAVGLLTYVTRAVSEICLDCGGPVAIVVASAQGIRQLTTQEIDAALAKIKDPLDKMRKVLPKRILKGESADRILALSVYPTVCESKRHEGKIYAYWWDVWDSRRAKLVRDGEIHLAKKDTGERAVVTSSDLLPLLTEMRRTTRMAKATGGNWGLKVLVDHPGEIAIEEPGVEPEYWARIPVTWVL